MKKFRWDIKKMLRKRTLLKSGNIEMNNFELHLLTDEPFFHLESIFFIKLIHECSQEIRLASVKFEFSDQRIPTTSKKIKQWIPLLTWYYDSRGTLLLGNGNKSDETRIMEIVEGYLRENPIKDYRFMLSSEYLRFWKYLLKKKHMFILYLILIVQMKIHM